jgi:hypothetical protein
MRNRFGFCAASVAMLAAGAAANGGTEDLDKVHVPALKDVTVSATAGKGITFDGGDTFKLNIKSQMQIQWRYSAIDGAGQDVVTIRARRIRTKLSGHAFSPKTRFMINQEWGRAAAGPLDIYLEQDLWENEEWSLAARGGRMKTLYGKEATGTSSSLMFVERSLATRTFADNRVLGVLATLTGMEDKFHAHLGTFNDSTAAGSFWASNMGANPDNEMCYTAGLRYDVHGDMGDTGYKQGDLARSENWNAAVHGNVWIGNETGPVGTADQEVLAFNLGGAFVGHGFSALGEFFWHSSEADVTGSQDHEAMGWNIQGTYNLEEGWGIGARLSMVTIDTINAAAVQTIFPTSAGGTGGGTALAGAGDVMEVTVGVSKFFNGHHRKVQADFTYQMVDPDAAAVQDLDNLIFRVMATVII